MAGGAREAGIEFEMKGRLINDSTGKALISGVSSLSVFGVRYNACEFMRSSVIVITPLRESDPDFGQGWLSCHFSMIFIGQ